MPRWMAFPPTAYTERGGVATVANANRAAWLAQPDEPADPDPAAPVAAAEIPVGGDGEAAADTAIVEEERLAA